jgi:hypothetical protein
MNIEQAVGELKALPIEEQQAVLVVLVNEIKKRQTKSQPSAVSALDAARHVLDWVGEGPSDLSSNPQYMDGYGQ